MMKHLLIFMLCVASAHAGGWLVHSMDRPLPPRAEPLPESELAERSRPPQGATVLFDGTDLSAFEPSKWIVRDGYVEVTPKGGNLRTKEAFGSCRLHLEWWTPADSKKTGQNRGNSGIFLMGRYEIQVLDTYENVTYADGVAGALYGNRPPDKNALRPPGNWQYVDIDFYRPVFDAKGNLLRPARVTVDMNGVRIHDAADFLGPSSHRRIAPYAPHADKLPLILQDHNETVRYRNIWIAPLQDDTP